MPRPALPLAPHPRPRAALVARVLTGVAFALFGLLVAGVILDLFDADPDNAVVGVVLDIAGWLGGPFEGLFDADDDETQVVFDWGTAALVYAVAGVVVGAAVDRIARIGR